MTRTLTVLLALSLSILAPRVASALIEGAASSQKINGARMPKGAAAIINRPERIAWWEGEGEFHAEGRGDVKVLNEILASFAKLDVKSKRIVVHDGVGQSYLLNMDNQPEKRKKARIDWDFMVWPSGKWDHFLTGPFRDNSVAPDAPEPPAQIDVYTSKIKWADVVVPAGIEVIDQRLEAHGFTVADGIVIEGHVKDIKTGQPIVATMRIQRVEPKTGNYVFSNIAEQSKSDADGHWVLKNLAPAQEWIRIVLEADGYAPRVVGNARFDDQPQWRSFDSVLMRPASISGRVTDAAGKPLADVELRLDDVIAEIGGEYESPTDYKFKTDAEGRFSADQVPVGKARIWLQKSGYSMGGLGQPINMPAQDIELQLIKAGAIRVTVDFAGQKRPKEYMVELEPEGGKAVGKYGGLGTIDRKNSFVFENVPPGKYVVKGHPNPTSQSQISDAITVDLQGDDPADVTIKAK